jgi:hypothetical protein
VLSPSDRDSSIATRPRHLLERDRSSTADPHHYDLVLESASLGVNIAADLIVRAVELGLPPPPKPDPAGER